MNYNKNSIKLIVIFILISSILLSGCSKKTGSDESSQFAGDTANAVNTSLQEERMDADEMFTDEDKEIGFDESSAVTIALKDNASASSNFEAVTVSGNKITISDEGLYVLSGTLTNGQIMIEAEKSDKVRLIFNGVNINCDTSAAIYIKQADKAFITLVKDTENTLSNKKEFVNIDDHNIDSVIFSKEDIILNGNGKLTINAVYGHGIVSKDVLTITSGTYIVTSASHSLAGKDSVRIADGNFTLISGKDGIHAEDKEDATKGFVYIYNGQFVIKSQGDGIDAALSLQIESVNIEIIAGSGSSDASKSTNIGFGTTSDSSSNTSKKGVKAAGNIIINGGTFLINSADDSVHSNSNIAINEGTFTLATGDDGVHADTSVIINAGSINITESYEGIEGQTIDITGGTIILNADDDGMNAAGGNDQSGFYNREGEKSDRFTSESSKYYINISGGYIEINSSGDGLDSNGKITVSGGEIYVSGPTSNGDGTLDCNGEAVITGGIVVAAGSSGMAENFGTNSTQGSMLVNIASTNSSGEIILKDSSGNVLSSYTPAKSYNSVVVSCPEIKQGETYTLTAGGQETTVTMSSLIYGSGGGFGGGVNPGGGMGGGSRPGMGGKR